MGRGVHTLREIREQPSALRETIKANADLSRDIAEAVVDRGFRRIYAVGSGSSFYSSVVCKHVIEGCSGLPVEAVPASEFVYYAPVIDDGTLIIATSRSGETSDLLASTRAGKERGGVILAITSTEGSSLAKESDYVLATRGAEEESVVQTKTFSAHLACGLLLAYHLGRARGPLPNERLQEIARDLDSVPDVVAQVLKTSEGRMKELARKYLKGDVFFFLGKGPSYGIACEGMLKLKEMSLTPAAAYPSGEFRHGPISVVEPGVTCVVINPLGMGYRDNLRLMGEIKGKGGSVVCVGSGDPPEPSDDFVRIPELDEYVAPIPSVIPLQLLGLYRALMKGLDPDRPRHLKRVVKDVIR
ncbi:TPA: SIS domain-containing protein [Candidatus Bathyarchaeota archaeon]|nr:SIS domain-containing protein [Candidatus Bathyarchaeota archaeon]